MNIAFLFFAKLIALFFLTIKKKYCFWAENNTKWSSFITMTVQTNLIILTFNCCLQFLSFVSLNYHGKLNNIICLVAFFLALYYATVFYLEIFLLQSEKAAKILLKFSSYEIKSFYFESYNFLMRTFIRGMIQGTLFCTYYSQIILSACSDFIFILITLFFRKQFTHTIVFFFVSMYNLLFFALDLGFLLLYRVPHIFNSFDY